MIKHPPIANSTMAKPMRVGIINPPIKNSILRARQARTELLAQVIGLYLYSDLVAASLVNCVRIVHTGDDQRSAQLLDAPTRSGVHSLGMQ